MNLQQLKYFLALAETLNFTKAAEKFYISQTAMTQQIKSLEKQLGVVLFNRTNRHVELSAAGKVFVHEAQGILAKIDEAVSRTKVASTGFNGELAIGYQKGYEHTELPRMLQNFHTEFPNISLSLSRDNVPTLYEDLLGKKYDIIFNIVFDDIETYTRLSYKLLRQYPLFVVVSPNHPLSQYHFIKMSQLKDEMFISYTFNANEYDGTKEIWDDFLQAGFVPKIIHQSNDVEVNLLMVSLDMGITLLPEYLLNTIPASMNLISIPLQKKHEFIRTGILWNKDNANPSLVKFLNAL